MDGRASGTNVTMEDVDALEKGMMSAWLLLCTFLVVSMQLGFAMLEVGSVRKAHRMTVLAKNITDSAVSCVAFFLYSDYLFSRPIEEDTRIIEQHGTLLNWAFCATSVTICSGCMAERTHIVAYLCYTVTMSGFIYPMLADAVWGSDPESLLYSEFHGRWVDEYHYRDFAGSGVVHLAGACAALSGNILLGRRILRPPTEFGTAPAASPSKVNNPQGEAAQWLDFVDEAPASLTRPATGWSRRFDSSDNDSAEFRGLNYLQVIGMFTLWIGWYGFNCGPVQCMTRGCTITIGTISWNTSLAACCGGMGGYIYTFVFNKNLDTRILCNTVLGGLVSITSCCDVASEGQAAIIGFAAGLVVYPLSCHAMHCLLLDDPVDAVPVHGACGCFGVLCTSFCSPRCGDLKIQNALGTDFCHPEFNRGRQLVAQVWGVFTIVWWTMAICSLVWGLFALFELARSLEVGQLEQADDILGRLGEVPGHVEAAACSALEDVAKGSPLARRILREHGWAGAGFLDGAPDVMSLRLELQRVCGERAETGLEVENSWLLRQLQGLARVLFSAPLFRKLLSLRLRISPVSEISGLGSADVEGGQLAALLWNVLEVQQDQTDGSSPLKNEVRELSTLVRSQDSYIRSLLQGRGASDPSFSSWQQRQSLPSVPEQAAASQAAAQTDDASTGSGRSRRHRRSRSDTVAAENPPVQTRSPQAAQCTHRTHVPRVASPGGRQSPTEEARRMQHNLRISPILLSGISASGSSTPGSRSGSEYGLLTPHSVVENTPPPSVIGQLSPHEVSGQVLAMLQAQQQFMVALQQAAASSASTPTTIGSLQGQLPLGGPQHVVHPQAHDERRQQRRHHSHLPQSGASSQQHSPRRHHRRREQPAAQPEGGLSPRGSATPSVVSSSLESEYGYTMVSRV